MTFWPARIGESVATGDAGLSSAMEAKPMLEIALQYADRGWRIIPSGPTKSHASEIGRLPQAVTQKRSSRGGHHGRTLGSHWFAAAASL